MILKASDWRAGDIEALEELLAEGVTPEQRSAIEAELYTIRQGARGERETAHILDRMYGHSDRIAVLHDVRLPDGLGGHVQFDHLLFNRVLKRIAVLETKNFSGRISKNEHNEWCVWYPNRRQPVEIPNPVAQANRAARLLELWLEAHQHSAAFRRIEGWVIVPPTCKIDRTRVGSGTRIVKVDNFHDRWVEDVGLMDTTGFLTGLSAGQLNAVGAQLAAHHVPPTYAWHRKLGGAGAAVQSSAPLRRPCETPESESELQESSLGSAATPQEDQSTASMAATTQPGKAYPDPNDQSKRGHQIDCNPTDSPPETTRNKSTSKATTLIPLADGISERALPDGRIAFVATPGTAAAEQLSAVCKGRAIWNPRFRNWLCSSERAEEIREDLLARAAREPS